MLKNRTSIVCIGAVNLDITATTFAPINKHSHIGNIHSMGLAQHGTAI